MATLKAVVRTARADGFYPVYIRVTHRRDSSFIKTDKMVTKKELTTTKEFKDADAILVERVKHLEELLAEKERLIRVYEKMVEEKK